MHVVDRLKITIPFAYMWVLRRSVGDSRTVLDLGCGDGGLTSVIAQGKSWEITGVDIYADSLKKAKKRGLYKELLRGDILHVLKKLLKEKKKYDAVFFSQVIEHIPREKGEKILDLLEKVARQRIVVGTPRGFMIQPEEFLGNNPYQIHQSGWSEADFEKRGYKIYGIGFNPVWSQDGLGRGKGKVSLALFTLLSYLFSPLVYFYPKLGAGILCIKDLR